MESGTGKLHSGKKKKPLLKQLRILIPSILILAGIIFGLIWWRYWANFVYTEDAHIKTHLILISSPLPAYISQLYADEGDIIKKKEPLAVVTLSDIITGNDLKSARAQAYIRYERAKNAVAVLNAQLTDARKNEERLKHIYAKGGASEQNLLDVKTRYEIIRARYESAQVTVGLAKNILDATYNRLEGIVLRSPINGRVSRRYANIGQNMAPGEPILGLVDLNNVWMEANVKETRIGSVKPGQTADIYIDAYPGVKFIGTVIHIESATVSAYSVIPAENPSGTFIKIVQRIPVKVAIDTKGYTLRPGMSAEVKIHIRKFEWL